MKLSDYVASFLRGQGIDTVFGVVGGANIHIMDSIDRLAHIASVPCHHEQAAGFAADAYARLNGLGCATGTSGPGATNLITAIASAYYDSVPLLFITGQVARERMRGDSGVRQLGFQETDIVGMVRGITKFAAQVSDPATIGDALDAAVFHAREGRPGPAVIDICDDVQRMDIDPDLRGSGASGHRGHVQAGPAPTAAIRKLIDRLAVAKRPVLVVGNGARGAIDDVREIARHLPVLPSWGAADMFTHDDPSLVATFGQDGTRVGNFAVQNADLVLAIGARLSTREMGQPPVNFAPGADLFVVDLDEAEATKFPRWGRDLAGWAACDAGLFARTLRQMFDAWPDIAPWLDTIRAWKRRYPVVTMDERSELFVNPYAFIEQLAEQTPVNAVITTDTGCAVSWTMQGWRFKRGQRVLHPWNNTPMGWGLPGAIGACLSRANRPPVIAICGDGGFMMNAQELATVARHRLPIKIFVINNDGYSMVRQTQEQWLGGRYHATSLEGGLGFPDFCKLAHAFNIESLRLSRNARAEATIRQAMQHSGPVLVDVIVPSAHRVIPKVRAGMGLEHGEPALPPDEMAAVMACSRN